MSVPHEVHDSNAAQAPVNGDPAKHSAPDSLPFAVVHVRLFEDSSASVVGDSKHREYAQKEQLGYVLDGFEQVLKVSRHKGFGFVDFVRWGLGQIGFMFFGIVLGALIGIRIKEIIGCGLPQ